MPSISQPCNQIKDLCSTSTQIVAVVKMLMIKASLPAHSQQYTLFR